jgi:hypothetical protein
MSELRAPVSIASPIAIPQVIGFPLNLDLLYWAISGFEIPFLPALPPERSHQFPDLLAQLTYRFQLFLLELHDGGARRTLALQLMADPARASVGALVSVYLLCRSSQETAQLAKADVEAFAVSAGQSVPSSGVFTYGQPRWLNPKGLQRAGFCDQIGPWPDVEIIELRKFEDRQTWSGQLALHYVPHRFWAEQRHDPWLQLIEKLAAASQPTAVRIELTPVRLDMSNGLAAVAEAGQWFATIGEDLDRRAAQGEQVRKDGVFTNEALRSGEIAAALASTAHGAYVQRGRHVFKQLVANAGRLFSMRVLLAARGPVPSSIVDGARAALCSPPGDNPMGSIGWALPDKLRPAANELQEARMNLNYLVPTRWGRTEANRALGPKLDLRQIVTPEEAVSLFHLPVYSGPGLTSALSTAETPFVIPPESLAVDRFAKEEKLVKIGYLYRREKLLDPESDGKKGHSFCVTVKDLMKPSLLVGAPGSGKSVMAFSILVQLWRDNKVPFLVLDPSTGKEYRSLLKHEKLTNEMAIYTIGDSEVRPLQFNPFSVPPGVTVRSHITRLMAAIQSAYKLPEGPFVIVYEAALVRLYLDERYCGKGRAKTMDSKGDLEGEAPTLNQFARAILDEVNEKVAPMYEGSKESIGVIRGACVNRVNALGNKMGFILNVPRNNGQFFQELLQRPAVIEFGALGDTTSIALVMAFFISQLIGHIEYAFAVGGDRQHVMLIEEAHRLLAGGGAEGAASKSAEDLNILLAEVRKFGQGIMILDQRPSSLVGGVLDNAFVKILMRLSDRVGFDRLSAELNLNEAQQRYARTRLNPGDAIVLDRMAGQPVLVHGEPMSNKRIDDEIEERELIRANAARWNLTPPEAVPFEEPKTEEKPTSPKSAAAPTAVKNPQEIARENVVAEIDSTLKAWLYEASRKNEVHWPAKKLLDVSPPDIQGAATLLDEALDGDFDLLDLQIRKTMKTGILRVLAEDVPKAKESVEAFAARESAAPQPVAAQLPYLQKAAKKWLRNDLEELAAELFRQLEEERNKSRLYADVKEKIASPTPDLDGAMAAATVQMDADRARFDRAISRLWTQMKWSVIGMIAAQENQEVVAGVQARKTETKPPEKA